MPNPQRITVRKLDAAGKQVFSYSGIVLRRDENCVQLEAHFSHDTIDVDYVVLERGDRFVEWHYADRWYNVFKIHAFTTGHF